MVALTDILAAVGVTAFVYYVVLTFSREIDHIWRAKRWDATNICFMWNRYSTLAGLIYGAYCTSDCLIIVGSDYLNVALHYSNQWASL